jgi:hypothetical protein
MWARRLLRSPAEPGLVLRSALVRRRRLPAPRQRLVPLPNSPSTDDAPFRQSKRPPPPKRTRRRSRPTVANGRPPSGYSWLCRMAHRAVFRSPSPLPGRSRSPSLTPRQGRAADHCSPIYAKPRRRLVFRAEAARRHSPDCLDQPANLAASTKVLMGGHHNCCHLALRVSQNASAPSSSAGSLATGRADPQSTASWQACRPPSVAASSPAH